MAVRALRLRSDKVFEFFPVSWIKTVRCSCPQAHMFGILLALLWRRHENGFDLCWRGRWSSGGVSARFDVCQYLVGLAFLMIPS